MVLKRGEGGKLGGGGSARRQTTISLNVIKEACAVKKGGCQGWGDIIPSFILFSLYFRTNYPILME